MDVPTDQAGPALPATEIPAGERGGRGSSAQLVPSTARTRGETTDSSQTRASSPLQRYPADLVIVEWRLE